MAFSIPFDPEQDIAERLSSLQDSDPIKLTALVSTYNSEKFISGCLQDLIAQSVYQKGELEILVIDSNSQQSEGQVVKDYLSRHKNISYIKTTVREPLYRAWNRGICFARGRYLSNANTDDRHSPDAYEIQLKVIEENPDCALVYGDLIVTRTENQNFQNCQPDYYIEYPDFDPVRQIHFGQCGPQPLWRKALHEKYGFFNEGFKICADYEWWLRISRFEKFIHVPALLGLYLDSPTSVEHRLPKETDYETNLIRLFYAKSSDCDLDFDKYANHCVKHFYTRFNERALPPDSLSMILTASSETQLKFFLERLSQEIGNSILEVIIVGNNELAISGFQFPNLSLRHIRQVAGADALLASAIAALHASSAWLTFAADTDRGLRIKECMAQLGSQNCQLFVSAMSSSAGLKGLFLRSAVLDPFRSAEALPDLVKLLEAVLEKAI